MAPSALRQALIAPSAIIDPTARIGRGTKVWAFCQIGEQAIVGTDCVIGNGAYIDRYVQVGDRVRIQNKALLYHGLIVEDDVFIGPGAVFTNDPWPRSGKTRDLKGISWKVRKGASIGANATILPDIEIGPYAVVGAGAVVTKNVPANALVYGNPATLNGYVCVCGNIVRLKGRSQKFRCPECGQKLAAKLR
jgi:UDP-3-O-[3-hydroxymyristoyl] glucosamine N-acyltransferase